MTVEPATVFSSGTIPSSLGDVIRKNGYAFLNEHHPEMATIELADKIGRTMTPWRESVVQELVPRPTATPNTYSGIYGLDRFPFHTDLAHWPSPPRYLLLRCVNGYADVPTLLLDGQWIFDSVTLDILTRAIFMPRRPRNGRLELLRLCEPIDGHYCFRWDEVFLRPASKVGKVADRLVRERISMCEPFAIALARAGDTLLIDNWRMLHARSPISVAHMDRKIQRVYLESLH